jgi:hypothetical protein
MYGLSLMPVEVTRRNTRILASFEVVTLGIMGLLYLVFHYCWDN